MNGSIAGFNSSMNLTARIVLLLKKHKGGGFYLDKTEKKKS